MKTLLKHNVESYESLELYFLKDGSVEVVLPLPDAKKLEKFICRFISIGSGKYSKNRWFLRMIVFKSSLQYLWAVIRCPVVAHVYDFYCIYSSKMLVNRKLNDDGQGVYTFTKN